MNMNILLKIITSRLFLMSLTAACTVPICLVGYGIHQFGNAGRCTYTDVTVREKFKDLSIDFSECSDLFLHEFRWLDLSQHYSFTCSSDYAKRWAKEQFDVEVDEPVEMKSIPYMAKLEKIDQSLKSLWLPQKVTMGFQIEIKPTEGKTVTLLYDSKKNRMYCQISEM